MIPLLGKAERVRLSQDRRVVTVLLPYVCLLMHILLSLLDSYHPCMVYARLHYSSNT